MRSVTTAIRSARMCHQQVYRCCSLMLPALCYASVTAGCTVEGGDNRTTRHKPCRTKKIPQRSPASPVRSCGNYRVSQRGLLHFLERCRRNPKAGELRFSGSGMLEVVHTNDC
uniref:Putative secreted protein n=1 Tax=Anopheles marajoara TaxID=58244 RepID=A0A2M4C7S4_9DIPT